MKKYEVRKLTIQQWPDKSEDNESVGKYSTLEEAISKIEECKISISSCSWVTIGIIEHSEKTGDMWGVYSTNNKDGYWKTSGRLAP